ncbi:MAG: WYL domain-containing protein [Bacteroidales bacterium]|nr:WYL domain-containing protein [Bacteroidales bacterium]
MAKNYFNRYVWLIDTINRHGHISREEISRLWQRSSLNDTGEELYERTFHNHREAILDTFGIEIKCDRSLGYYIANSDDLESNGIRQWLLESLSMNNLLNGSSDMRDRILFEKIPSSQRWLPVIVNAMREEKAVELTYKSFSRNGPSTFILHPYCLKLFKQRWYVLGRSEGYEDPRIYALDERMKNVVPLKKALKMPAKFNAGEFFRKYFGVIIDDRKPTTVKLKVVSNQVRYIDSLPLHESQSLIEETPEYGIFEYCLVPTYDFRQELLSHGPDVEVLEPEELRDEIKADIARMYRNYGL